jgi:uncharacterized protein with PIN domain
VPRFFCDDHLRRLARWLRAAGFDTAWEADVPNRRLLERCRAEERVLLTLDRPLTERRTARGVEIVVLSSHEPFEQLVEVRRRFHLDLLANAFTRCPVCNEPLDRAENPEVPPRVRETCAEFRRCPGCGRVYWEGDHVRNMVDRFRAAGQA